MQVKKNKRLVINTAFVRKMEALHQEYLDTIVPEGMEEGLKTRKSEFVLVKYAFMNAFRDIVHNGFLAELFGMERTSVYNAFKIHEKAYNKEPLYRACYKTATDLSQSIKRRLEHADDIS